MCYELAYGLAVGLSNGQCGQLDLFNSGVYSEVLTDLSDRFGCRFFELVCDSSTRIVRHLGSSSKVFMSMSSRL